MLRVKLYKVTDSEEIQYTDIIMHIYTEDVNSRYLYGETDRNRVCKVVCIVIYN